MKYIRSSTLRGVVLLTATGITSQIIAFVYRIFLSQMVGAEILGLYQLIMPVYAVLLSLSSVGLTSAVSNLSARFQAMGDLRGVWEVRTQALRLFFLLAALPCTLLLCCSDGVSVFIIGDARTRLGLLLLVPCLLLTGVENVQKYYFYGTGFVRPAAVTELIEQVLRTILILGLLALLLPQYPERVVGIIVTGMILCEIFSAVTQTVLFRRHLGPPGALRGEHRTQRALSRSIMTIAVPVGFTALLGNLIGSANSILVPRLLVQGGMERAEAMQSFGVMFGMTFPMLYLPTAFLGALNLILAPKLAEAAALGRMDLVRLRVRKSVAAANLLLIPALALLAVVGPGLGAILYKDPRVGNHLDLLAFGVLLSCWQTLMANALSGLNLQAKAAKIVLFSDVVQLAITWATVGRPEWGLRGFAWGYVISSALAAWLCWRKLSAETKLTLPVYDWFAAPLLGAALAATSSRLLHTILLRDGAGVVPTELLCLVFGLLLYLAALQAQGISFRGLLRDGGLVKEEKKR